MDEVFHDIIAKIADLAFGSDPEGDDRNVQWQEGYQQACRDISLIIARAASKQHNGT